MNTDQGSQFTSSAFIKVLERNSIQSSMDGKCMKDFWATEAALNMVMLAYNLMS